MWFERFVIIVVSLSQDYLPSAWRLYRPTMVDFAILLGSFGLFFTLVLLFARVLPVIATSEGKAPCLAPSLGMEAAMSDKAFAVLGLFDSADALMAAIPQVKARKLGRLEAYTPYPIHGMDEALDLRRSPLGGMVLVMGILGAITTLGFEYWMSAVDYPIVTGGKAPWSWSLRSHHVRDDGAFRHLHRGLGMLLLLNKLPFFRASHPRFQGHPQHHAGSLRAGGGGRSRAGRGSREGRVDCRGRP